MTWTLSKINEVEDNEIKVRLLEEWRRSMGRRPITGDLEYWSRLVYLKDVDYRKNPEHYSAGRGHQGVLSTEPYSSEVKPYYDISDFEKSFISAFSISEFFYIYLEQEDYVGCDICRKFLSMGRMRNKFFANQMIKRFKKKKMSRSAKSKFDQEKYEDRILSSEIFQSFHHGVRDEKVYLELKRDHIKMYRNSF